MRFKQSHWKRRLARFTPLTESECAEMDKMIAEAKRGTAERESGIVKVTRRLETADLGELGHVEVWVFYWSVNGMKRGRIGYRMKEDTREAEEELAMYQATLAKYFADGVNPKSIVMNRADGTTERLK